MKHPTILITITTLFLNNTEASFLSCLGNCNSCLDCISKLKSTLSTEPKGQLPIINNNINISADSIAREMENINATNPYNTGWNTPLHQQFTAPLRPPHYNSLSQDIQNIEMSTYRTTTERTEHIEYSGENQLYYSQTTTTTEVFESPMPQNMSPFPIQHLTPYPYQQRFSNGSQRNPIPHLIDLPHINHGFTPRHSYPLQSTTPVIQELISPPPPIITPQN